MTGVVLKTIFHIIIELLGILGLGIPTLLYGLVVSDQIRIYIGTKYLFVAMDGILSKATAPDEGFDEGVAGRQ